MPELEVKRKAEELSVVPAKKTRHEISVVGTREKAVVTSSVSFVVYIFTSLFLYIKYNISCLVITNK